MGSKKPGSRADRLEKAEKLRREDPEAAGLTMSQKQIRARARRKARKHQQIAVQEFEKLYKPIDEWDMEELARGRPRASDGSFKGRPPSFISREVHEKAMERFRDMVKGEMAVHTVSALKLLGEIIDNDDVDQRGRAVIPWTTKLEATKFLLEHVVGKPKQPVEADISVKLSAILGDAIVNPAVGGFSGMSYSPSSPSSARRLALVSGEDDDIEEAEVVDE